MKIKMPHRRETSRRLTYTEGGVYYGVIQLRNGHEFYIGPWNSRSTARRHALRRLAGMREL